MEKYEKPHENAGCHLSGKQQMLYNEIVDKNAPGSATNTENPGANHCEGVAMTSVPQIPDWIANEDIATSFLEFAAHDFANAKAMRVFYAKAARAHGIPFRKIGDIYGVTATAVQLMIKRSSDETDPAQVDLAEHESLIYSTAFNSGFKAGRAFECENGQNHA